MRTAPLLVLLLAAAASAQSTRVTDPEQHVRKGPKSYPYRALEAQILRELDLREGDVVADIGAGDGWWAERMAKAVGATGVVHALEVEPKKVDGMKKKYADVPQIRPALCPKDGTGLDENSCDLALFSQVFHHLPKDGRVDYLRHLRKVLKPTGRVVVIEKYVETVTGRPGHGTRLSVLVAEAEEAGWAPVKTELMTSTYHYLAIFVQKDLFPAEPPPKKRNTHTKDALETVKRNVAEGKAVLVDVRERREWDAGHLDAAVWVPLSGMRKPGFTTNLPKDRIVYLHCRSGNRVLTAAPILRKLGLGDVRALKAGYAQLRDAGVGTK